MQTRAARIWITALVLGWLLDFLFWKQAPGINFAIYAGLCLVGGFIVLSLDGKRIAARAVPLVLLVVVFASITFIRFEPLTSSLAGILTLFFMSVLAITFLGGRWLEYSLADYASGFFRLAWSMLSRPFGLQAEVARERRELGKPASSSWVWPIVRGILIALPVLLIFGALLASADLVFGKELENLARLLRLENLPQYVFRLVYILLAAYTLAGVFLHAASQSREEHLVGETKPLSPRFLGFLETEIVLGSVIVLFAAFVIVQFRYFFGGQVNINIEGYTYSEYARRGFGELLTVAFFSLLLILGLGAVTRRDSPSQQRLFSILSIVVVALVGVMLVSAYQRLSLYEDAYGFSRLRTYSHVFLVWISLLLAAVVVLEILRRERFFAMAAIASAVGFALTLAFLNVDGFIARQNIARLERGSALDVPYLVSLSSDSVPDLAASFDSPATLAPVRDAVGAVLACRLARQPQHPISDWRSFNLARARASAILQRLQAPLSAYVYKDELWPATVMSPNGAIYDCAASPAD